MALIIGIGYFQIPTADDLIYLNWVEELGIWESTMLLRQEWNTRWAAILINQTYLSQIPKQFLGIAYQVTTLGLGLLAFYPITKNLVPARTILKREIISISLLVTLFLLSFGLSDSWFWMCSQPAYLWATLISIWIITMLLRPNLNRAYGPILILTHLYVGGASELVAISVLLIELSLLLFITRIELINKKMLLIGLISLTISMVFALSGEGIENRYTHLSPPGIVDGIVISFKSYLKILVYGIGSKLVIIGSALLVLLAIRQGRSNHSFFDWKIPFGIADGVLICTMTITGFTLGGIGPNRALIHISAMVLVLVIIVVPLINFPFLTNQILLNCSVILCVILSGYLTFNLVMELPKEAAYSDAMKNRMVSINKQIDAGASEIKLKPLPDSKFLYRAEISEDPTNENNKQLSTIYGGDLQFLLIVSE